MAIEFLYFDLGNVLLKFSHQRACDQMAEVAGIPAAQVYEIVFDSGLNERYERGEITTRQFHEGFDRSAGVQTPATELLHAWNDIFDLHFATIPIVANLHAAGYPLGVLSNTSQSHWEFVLRKFVVLSAFFSLRVTSFETHAMKPDPRIYQHAAALANVSPESIFFVDDRAENVRGASQFGWQTNHFTGAIQLADALNQLGVTFNR